MRAWQREGDLILSDHKSLDDATATQQFIRVESGLVEVRA